MIRSLRLLLCCVVVAGCSRGAVSVLPTGISRGAATKTSPNGAVFRIVYTFTNIGDGADPSGNLLDLNGSLYGTATRGGQGCCGVAFKLNGSTESVLHSFEGKPDGSGPFAGLTAVKGALYGTTAFGGARGNNGVVFKIDSSGKETVVYRFKGEPYGTGLYNPVSNVGNTLYGTTLNGGTGSCRSRGCGTIYKITSSGKESVLYDFKGGADGDGPSGPLIYADGALYGETIQGGTGCYPPAGCGTVFRLTLSGSEQVLYRFKGGTDGEFPSGGLIVFKGAFYGATEGGVFRTAFGTVFKLTRAGAEDVLYRFKNSPDGAQPTEVIEVNGALYGTTQFGGDGACSNGCGTIFKISLSGTETMLHRFNGSDGQTPSGLINVGSTLYGTTCCGDGDTANGSVFALTL